MWISIFKYILRIFIMCDFIFALCNEIKCTYLIGLPIQAVIAINIGISPHPLIHLWSFQFSDNNDADLHKFYFCLSFVKVILWLFGGGIVFLQIHSCMLLNCWWSIFIHVSPIIHILSHYPVVQLIIYIVLWVWHSYHQWWS